MVNQELANYFLEGFRRGNSLEVLEKSLIDAGWPRERVLEASSYANKKFGKGKKNGLKPKLGLGSLAKKVRPKGVVAVSVLHWIIAFSWFMYFVLFGSVMFSFFGSSLGASSLVVAGIIGLVISSLPFFVGLGIWNGVNGWRIVGVVFSAIFTFLGVLSLFNFSFQGVLVLGVSAYSLFYLAFNKRAREYFHGFK